MNGNDKIIIRFGKKSASTTSTSITININNADSIVLSTCTSNSIPVFGTASSDNIFGSVKSLFGL